VRADEPIRRTRPAFDTHVLTMQRRFVIAILLCAALFWQVEALRRNSDDDQSDNSFEESDVEHTQTEIPAHVPLSQEPDSNAQQPEDGSEPADTPKPGNAGGLIPVITVVMCSKLVPHLAAAGQMPILASILIAPRVVAYLEQAYDLNDLPGWAGMLIAAMVSFSVLNTIVSIGTMLGVFKVESESHVGKKSCECGTAEICSGQPCGCE